MPWTAGPQHRERERERDLRWFASFVASESKECWIVDHRFRWMDGWMDGWMDEWMVIARRTGDELPGASRMGLPASGPSHVPAPDDARAAAPWTGVSACGTPRSTRTLPRSRVLGAAWRVRRAPLRVAAVDLGKIRFDDPHKHGALPSARVHVVSAHRGSASGHVRAADLDAYSSVLDDHRTPRRLPPRPHPLPRTHSLRASLSSSSSASASVAAVTRTQHHLGSTTSGKVPARAARSPSA